MSSTIPDARGPDRPLPIPGGAVLRVSLPAGAVDEAPGELPAVDVSNLPGASVPVKAGFRGADATVRVVCATAPSSGWAPGVEQLVMGRASQIAGAALGGEVTRFEAEETTARGVRFEQPFTATVRRGGDLIEARGRHVLGFVGEARDAVVCTALCTEAHGRGACAALVEGTRPEGVWVEAPPPSVVVRGILLAAEHPSAALAVVIAATIALATLVIARRPRPTRSVSDGTRAAASPERRRAVTA